MINDWKVFTAKPGEEIENDFDCETWIKMDDSSDVAKCVQEKLSVDDDNFSKIGYMGTVKCIDNDPDGVSTHYMAFYYGGLNGAGPKDKWKRYLDDIGNLMNRFNHSWLIQLENDCCDDVWYLVLGFYEENKK